MASSIVACFAAHLASSFFFSLLSSNTYIFHVLSCLLFLVLLLSLAVAFCSCHINVLRCCHASFFLLLYCVTCPSFLLPPVIAVLVRFGLFLLKVNVAFCSLVLFLCGAILCVANPSSCAVDFMFVCFFALFLTLCDHSIQRSDCGVKGAMQSHAQGRKPSHTNVVTAPKILGSSRKAKISTRMCPPASRDSVTHALQSATLTKRAVSQV